MASANRMNKSSDNEDTESRSSVPKRLRENSTSPAQQLSVETTGQEENAAHNSDEDTSVAFTINIIELQDEEIQTDITIKTDVKIYIQTEEKQKTENATDRADPPQEQTHIERGEQLYTLSGEVVPAAITEEIAIEEPIHDVAHASTGQERQPGDIAIPIVNAAGNSVAPTINLDAADFSCAMTLAYMAASRRAPNK